MNKKVLRIILSLPGMTLSILGAYLYFSLDTVEVPNLSDSPIRYVYLYSYGMIILGFAMSVHAFIKFKPKVYNTEN